MNRVKHLLTALMIMTISASVHAESCPAAATAVLSDATQLLVVTTANWDTSKAQLRLWQRSTASRESKGMSPNWKPASAPIDAVIGKNGAAWGYPYWKMKSANELLKHEGDGRSPAGAFPLGRRFGFAAGPTSNYLQIKSSTVCVDDPLSAHYNAIVDSSSVAKDWSSAEDMAKVQEYRHGMEIAYPSSASEKAGSCIFFHIWSAPTKGTAGCTAVAEDKMTQVQTWLRDDSHAAILLVPKSELKKFAPCLPGVASMDIAF